MIEFGPFSIVRLRTWAIGIDRGERQPYDHWHHTTIRVGHIAFVLTLRNGRR